MDKNQLSTLRAEHADLEQKLQVATSAGDQDQVAKLAKRYAKTSTFVAQADELEAIEKSLTEARATADDASDPELQAMAAEEITVLEKKQATIEAALDEALNPPDPNDQKDILVEIRAGAGGDEAALFAAQL